MRKRGSNCVLVKEGREEERRGGLGHRMAGMMRNRYRVGHLILSHFPFPPLLYVNKVWKLFLFSFGRWKFLQRGEEGTKSDFNLTDECIKEVSAKHSLMRLVLVETMNTAPLTSPSPPISINQDGNLVSNYLQRKAIMWQYIAIMNCRIETTGDSAEKPWVLLLEKFTSHLCSRHTNPTSLHSRKKTWYTALSTIECLADSSKPIIRNTQTGKNAINRCLVSCCLI